MTVPSIRQILLLESTRVRGEMFTRRPNGTWPEEAQEFLGTDEVRIEQIEFSQPLSAFYARTSLA